VGRLKDDVIFGTTYFPEESQQGRKLLGGFAYSAIAIALISCSEKSEARQIEKVQSEIIATQIKDSSIDKSKNICLTECGLSKVDWYLKNFHVENGHLIENMNPRDFLSPSETKEFNKRFTNIAISQRLNLNYEIDIRADIFFVRKDGVWTVDYTRIRKPKRLNFISNELKFDIVKALAETNYIEVISEVNNSIKEIKFTEKEVENTGASKETDASRLKLTLPLYSLGKVDENDILFFRSSFEKPNCQAPNTHFIRELTPLNDIGRSLAKLEPYETYAIGFFSTCAYMQEWQAQLSIPQLNQIGD